MTDSTPATAAPMTRFSADWWRREFETYAGLYGRLRDQLEAAANEGRNVLPDATDDQAAVIEAWAKEALDVI